VPRKQAGHGAAFTQHRAPHDRRTTRNYSTRTDPDSDNTNNGNNKTLMFPNIVSNHSISVPTISESDIAADVLDEWEDTYPLIPLHLLLLTDATPAEIASRLRFNFCIRRLCEALAAADAAAAGGATW
jgi:hypothetical protein